MKRINLLILLLILTGSLFPLPVFGDRVSTKTLNALDLQAHLFEDPEGIHTIESLLQGLDPGFIAMKRPVIAAGYTSSIYWLRIQLPPSNEERILVLAKPVILKAELYLFEAGRLIHGEAQGLSVSTRAHQSRFYSFQIPAHTAQQTIYLRYQNRNALIIGPSLWDKESFLLEQGEDFYRWGAFFGVMVVMGAFNFFIFLSIRDRSSFDYVIFLICVGLFQYITRGFTPFWLAGEGITYTDFNIVLFASLATIAGLIFLKNFIELPSRQPVLGKGVWLLGFALGLVLCLSPWPTALLMQIMVTLINLSVVYGLVCATRAYALGFKPARFYIIAATFMLLGTVTYIFTLQGWLSYNWVTGNALALGCVFEVTLFSFAMAERIHILRKEKEQADLKALALQQKMAQELEVQVVHRTQDLAIALGQVQEQKKHIMESIQYAQHIQSSLLPKLTKDFSALADHFIYWQPRDIVGGDIYFIEPLEEGVMMAVFDCTGHGVPGAFMTMLTGAAMKHLGKQGHYRDPAKLLQQMNHFIHQSLTQKSSDDGMDSAVLYYDQAQGQLTFAGAKLPLVILQEDKLEVIEGDRMSIGYQNPNLEFEFTNHVIPTENINSCYLFSDGYMGQDGGVKGLSFGKKQFFSMLRKIEKLPMQQQRNVIEETLVEYQGENSQRDDITILGIKLHDAGQES